MMMVSSSKNNVAHGGDISTSNELGHPFSPGPIGL